MSNLFKEKKLKLTTQRKIIMELVDKLGDTATPKNIVKNCENKVDKSTVYRIIDLFVEKNIFDRNLNYNNEIYYSIKESHTHYFTCVVCHKKEKLNDCPLNNIKDTLENEKGYKVLNHTIHINGICNKCLDTN